MSKARFSSRGPLPLLARNPLLYWLLLCLIALLTGLGLHSFIATRSEAKAAAPPPQLLPQFWEELPRERAPRAVADVLPGRAHRALRLNRSGLQQFLQQAPLENTVALNQSQSLLSLPLPDGGWARFRVEESPTMEPALAARYPDIKSYRGQGVDDPTLTVRFDDSPRGLHALILTSTTAITIAPQQADDLTTYVSYYGQDAASPTEYECLTQQLPGDQPWLREQRAPQDFSFGTMRRNYRIAIATTVEYTNTANLGGGSKTTALASVNSWLNAVNAIYERDLAVHFNLVANNDQIIFTSTDGFTNGNASTMLTEVRGVLGNTIGPANYDVGHVLGTGSSGVAYLGVVCNDGGSAGPIKGGGVSLIASSASIGNTFYITRIAHELGHQFGAAHSFNDDDANYGCASNRFPASAWESGSGYTVMSYAGSCNPISGIRAQHFLGGSIHEMAAFIEADATCATLTNLNNAAPTVNGGADYRIPRNTPFALTATASDPNSADNAALTYAWEQYDAGDAFGNPPFTDAGDPATTTRPIFRPYAPTTNRTRYFPSLTYILNNANVPPATTVDSGYVVYTGESLPNVTRTLNFKVTVRDQRGGVKDDDVLLEVEGGAGPFAVTAPNTNVTWAGGSQQTVTWSVNNTNAAPINCTQVRLLLSTDGGNTFPITLLSATANDGSEAVTVPSGYNSTTARLKVEAVNNIFFDISDANFSLTQGTTACPTVSGLSPASGPVGATVTVNGSNFTGVSAVKFTNNLSASFSIVSNTQLTAVVPAGAVSGPLTISKTGCSDVQSGTFTVGSCTYSLSAPSFSAAATASTSSVNVTGGTGCAWTATSNANWLTISSGASGSGSGTVNFAVAANTGAARSGTLTIAGQTFTVNQAAGCTFTLSATSFSAAATASTSSVNVTSGTGCAWTAASNANWLTISGGASGSGNGTVNFAVAANTGAARSGTLTIAGQTFTVNQAAGCTFTLSATSFSAAATASTSSVNVTSGTGCAWTAASNANWLTISSGASGSGSGTVNFAVAANTGAARSGTLTIAGQTFTVNQAAGCTFTLSATSFSATASASTSSVNVTSGTGCAWTATSGVTWLTISSGAAGSGNGTVNFSIAANTGAARSGTLTVAGQTFTVNQASGCTFTINPSSQNVAGTGGTGSLAVTAAGGCSWTALSNDNWITISSGASGSGNGTVNFTVAANTGAARSGTLTAAGKTFTVTQAANCSFTISPSSANLAATASAGSVTVTSSNGCDWTATSGAAWLTIASGASGSGNGTVNFNAAANPGPARTGTLTIAGKTFTVTQAGGCTFALSATSKDFTTTGGTGSVNVTSGTGCAWTATSSVNWVTISAGANGSGNGTVNFTVAANSGPGRSAALTIAGQTFTISQGSGCAVQLSATTASVGAAAATGTVNVTAASGCAWTALSNANWLTVSGGASGSGNGTVTYAVAANTGGARTGTLTIGGITFTVTQAAAACAFTVTPLTQTFAAAGGSASVAVTTASHCTWTAASNANWLGINGSLSFTGNGTVNYSAAANATGAARSGSLTVAGQTLTVTQAANVIVTPVLSSLSPTYVAAGSAQFTLTVNGSNFSNGATVRWNGSNRATTFKSSTQLQATIAAADVATAGLVTVTVFESASNVTSNGLPFAVAAATASLSAASYTGADFAPEQIVATFGQKMATGNATATTLPLPTTLGGTTVKLKDSAGVERSAPLFFVSAGQINFQIPLGTAPGAASLLIQSGDGNVSMGSLQVSAVAPGLFSANASGKGLATGQVLRVKANGAQSYEAIFRYDTATKTYVALPIDLSTATDSVYLILYGTGLRQRSSLSNVACLVGGVAATVSYAGKQGGLVGVDQLNILLPRALVGRGEVDVAVTVDGKTANLLKVQIK